MNKTYLNDNKTKCMLIATKQKRLLQSWINNTLGDTVLDNVSSVKRLRVTIQNNDIVKIAMNKL